MTLEAQETQVCWHTGNISPANFAFEVCEGKHLCQHLAPPSHQGLLYLRCFVPAQDLLSLLVLEAFEGCVTTWGAEFTAS